MLSSSLEERLTDTPLGAAGSASADASLVNADASLVNSETFNTITVNDTVGIGTSGPVTALDFGASTDLSGDDQVIGLRNNGNSRFGFGTSGQNLMMYVPSDLSTENGITFGTMSTFTGSTFSEKVRITTEGKVGIGATGPVTPLDFGASTDLSGDDQVIGVRNNGSSRFGFGTSGQNFMMYFPSDLSAGNGITFGTMNTGDGSTFAETVRFTRTGTVGIGTSSPSSMLEVAGEVTISGAGNGLTFPNGTRQTTAAGGAGVVA